MPKIINHLFGSDEQHLERLKEGLLLAASELAEINPIEKIEVEAIVTKAEISKGTFYKLFKSVNGLFEALGKKLTNEMMEYFLFNSPDIPDVTNRVANKTKTAFLIAANVPFLGKLLLNAEWPSCDPDHILYKDIEKDVVEGIRLGHFSDMPPSIGVSIIVGSLRGGFKEIIEKKPPKEYMDKAVCQVLVSLGVNEEVARAISKNTVSELPALPIEGIASIVLANEK